ncbi:Molybdopterin-guanine dinucleotide biosynthesis adapter protein [bioreactor metagenome]|uniref:Molybdopterin-guanine dinucleotide biosynthesis adapter protein n=1 Tax=bioreactor metagenome TaxID=1076179 RepID=A0A644TJB1_9ZZZZ|nr:molybdopterin-guanine dinucleotide biosynthesis protein B [Negativicutes bacterium]
MANSRIPVISFVAKSGSGKTTLLEKVIRKLKEDGIRLAVIKHDAHEFDIDKPGKDTWRMAQAGADIVAISSPKKMAIIEKVNKEKTVDEVIAMISNVDLILTEGFKKGNKPKIEVLRSEVNRELLSDSRELLAIASDIEWDVGVPYYHLDDTDGIVAAIKQYMSNFPQ